MAFIGNAQAVNTMISISSMKVLAILSGLSGVGLISMVWCRSIAAQSLYRSAVDLRPAVPKRK
ncbi:hypothetical protein MWU53_10285 [Aliiroseovarius sp. S1123]|nr:hypothetical protein [Aliiroseovarius sp. S1123]